MPDDDLVDRFERYLEQQSNRGFGDIPLRPTAALAPISRAQMDAAHNLLTKALRWLDAGDVAKARAFVERAVALPFDEHEQMHPAAMMGSQQLYDTVIDALEKGGDDWLDAAADTFRSAPEEARYCLRDTLLTTIDAYELTPDQERRVRRLTKDVPPRAELADLDLPREELAAAVFDVLEGVIVYVDAYEELAYPYDDE